MNKKLSRRQALASGTVVAVAAIGRLGHQKVSPKESDDANQQVQSLLAEPLAGDSLANLTDAITGVHQTSEGRWKHKLTENSEPNLIFKALPKEERSW